jgi:RHS repeat-associated protein
MWINNIEAETVSPSTAFFQLQPGYYSNGNVKTVVNALTSGRTQTFTYDNLNRWITAKSSATSGTYSWGQTVPPYSGDSSNGYDRYGNLMKIDVTQGTAPALNISVNSYNQVSGYSYDNDGNLLSDGTYSYTWNGEGEMTGEGATNYTYDGDRQRVELSSGTLSWYAPDGNLVGGTDYYGNPEAEYVYFNGARVAANVPTNTVYYYFSDQIGSLQTVTNSTGTICYDSDNTPNGYRFQYVTTCAQQFGLAAMKLDAAAPNYYTLFRQYSYGTARWLSPDPLTGDISNPQSLNRYVYVMNNPMGLVDTAGLCPGWQMSAVSDSIGNSSGASPTYTTYYYDDGLDCTARYDFYYLQYDGQALFDVLQKLGDSNNPCANATLTATGVNAKQNIAQAKKWIAAGSVVGSLVLNPLAGALAGYAALVGSGEPQDVKNQPGPGTHQQRVDAGNISFGITCPFGAQFCQFAAGAAQTLAGHPDPKGNLSSGFDTPSDNASIQQGQAMRAAGCH